MARYRSDYGRDYSRWREPGPYLGGMRSDGWGGTGEWKRFPGEEGWYGEGYDGIPGIGYDSAYGVPDPTWSRAGYVRYGRRPVWEPRYDGEFGARGLSRWDLEYGRRDAGYAQGWEEPRARHQMSRTYESFETRPIRATDIMTENPHVVTPDASIIEAARKMRDLDVGIIPVVDNEENRRLRGVLTDRDIAIRCVADGKDGKLRVNECMTADVRSVGEHDSIRDVMRVMRDDLIRRVPVTDREGRLVGIIAQADLAVDYASRDIDREGEFAETVERISEPAQPRREAFFDDARATSRPRKGKEKSKGKRGGARDD